MRYYERYSCHRCCRERVIFISLMRDTFTLLRDLIALLIDVSFRRAVCRLMVYLLIRHTAPPRADAAAATLSYD